MYFDITDYTMLCDFWPIAQKILKELSDSGMAKPFSYPSTYLLELNCLALKAIKTKCRIDSKSFFIPISNVGRMN